MEEKKKDLGREFGENGNLGRRVGRKGEAWTESWEKMGTLGGEQKENEKLGRRAE